MYCTTPHSTATRHDRKHHFFSFIKHAQNISQHLRHYIWHGCHHSGAKAISSERSIELVDSVAPPLSKCAKPLPRVIKSTDWFVVFPKMRCFFFLFFFFFYQRLCHQASAEIWTKSAGKGGGGELGGQTNFEDIKKLARSEAYFPPCPPPPLGNKKQGRKKNIAGKTKG